MNSEHQLIIHKLAYYSIFYKHSFDQYTSGLPTYFMMQ